MSEARSYSASSCRWESYPWKNELQLQAERVELHLEEAWDDDFAGEHSPLQMLERALVLAAFSIRRMVEKNLVTDALSASITPVRTFLATGDYRPPLKGSSGGQVFRNYNFEVPVFEQMKVGDIANEIIHSSQLLVFQGDGQGPDSGLLVASDWHIRRRLLHLSRAEFRNIVNSVLDNEVSIMGDHWDPETGKVHSKRD